jgi:signal transduction histidine kinase
MHPPHQRALRKHRQVSDLLVMLRRLRIPLSLAVGLLFGLTNYGERLLFNTDDLLFARLIDPLFWGTISATAIWLLLSWILRQETRRLRTEAEMLAALQRSNERLELLYEINQRIVAGSGLDSVLDYAISLPARLVGARAAAIVLFDETGVPSTARAVGIDDLQLRALRTEAGLGAAGSAPERLRVIRLRTILDSSLLLVPLTDGRHAALGWLEALLPLGAAPLSDRGGALLTTVAAELAEAILGARRQARTVNELVAIEQAITAERTRIARDLHDGVAQSLAFLRMRVDLWSDWLQTEPQRLPAEFVQLKQTLREQIGELRRAIFALRPFAVGQLGFSGALRGFIHEFAELQGWECRAELDQLPEELPHELELAAFRIVQEALANAAKHAQAQRVTVSLAECDGGLQITVTDDGVGFRPGASAPSAAGGLGLPQMAERAAALGGRLTVLAQPGSGAEIRVWLPLQRDCGTE